ncbi:MAG: hypothetical protein ACRDTX_20865 [Pseudonocardiaceae bacterium]
MVLLNESFASTNEREGSEIATSIVRVLLETGIKVFFVTHSFDRRPMRTAPSRLAESAAGTLQAIERRSTTVAELWRGVADLDQRTLACPVCAALREAEGDAVAGAASGGAPATGAEVPPLCVHHVAAVLGVGPSLDRGRALVRGLAIALRRASEDMRAYALKREGNPP